MKSIEMMQHTEGKRGKGRSPTTISRYEELLEHSLTPSPFFQKIVRRSIETPQREKERETSHHYTTDKKIHTTEFITMTVHERENEPLAHLQVHS
jgi:hypothetical protein